jgi:hypothetical protein
MADSASDEASSRRRFELQQRILAMPEHQSLLQLDNLSTSLWVFEQNYREFILLAEKVLKGTMQLTSRDNRMLFEASMYELTRLLHNFVASVSSLVDHTRRLYEEHYADRGLFPEYQAEVEHHFVNCSLAKFVQSLRQYTLHYGLPGIALETRILNMETEEMAHTLTMPKKNLQGCGFKWAAKAKEFMDGCLGNSIDLLHATDNYHTLVVRFYQWFVSKQHEIHRQDYEVVSRSQEEYLALAASDVPKLISDRLRFLPLGLGAIQNVLGCYLTRQQSAEIDHIIGRPMEWTQAALQRIRKNVPLPSELIENIMRFAKSTPSA